MTATRPLALAAALLCVATALSAQDTVVQPGVSQGGTTAAAGPVTRYAFDIPSLPLPDALAEWCRQSRTQVRAQGIATVTVRARAIAGTYTPAEAIAHLLEGTPYSAHFEDGVAVVHRVGEGQEANHTLDRVVVRATRAARAGYATRAITTATRTETPLRDTPQSVSVIGRTLIADQGMQTMADVVRHVPGVSMGQGEGHRDAPTIRGNSSTADFFVNGVRDDAQYLRDLYNVERVEALKGANAMTFGRGGGGGVINRVTRQAEWLSTRELTLNGGSYGHRRGSADFGGAVNGNVAARVTAMLEQSDLFRDRSEVQRYAVNPTAVLVSSRGTIFRLGYERLVDERTVDRGLPSFDGRPFGAPITRFFGDPGQSRSEVDLHAIDATITHELGGLTIRNATRAAAYDKWYRNVYPGSAVNAAGTTFNLAAYESSHDRDNLFNQTDLTWSASTGAVRHTLLAGAEFGTQRTDNYRATGYFGNTATSQATSVDAPTVAADVTYRQSATDADNRVGARVASAYLQDQVAFTRWLQAIGGVRVDRFALDFRNNRNAEELARTDVMLSPRAGLVVKPVQPISIYGSLTVSHLPSSGDQFASLTATTKALEPERFTNREVGVKWDVRQLAFTASLYELDRTNTSAPHPTQAGVVVQTGEQRSSGYELGVSGAVTGGWDLAAGFTSQKATITSTTTAAAAGKRVPLVPRHTISLWNRVRVTERLSVGGGVVRQEGMYAAIDNAVMLPGFTRADAAVYVRLTPQLQAQLNVENLLDAQYYPTSHGNNNIMPGAPRTLRLSLSTRR